MPQSPNQRAKLLYLMKILLEKTDVQSPMTISEIIAELAAYNITSERKSIYTDFEILRQFGLDIETQRSKTTGYYISNRDFELPELKLLVDAVQSSKLITNKKSRELIGKLSKLTSAAQAKQLNRQVYVSGRAKAINETVYYSIDAIHTAINEGKKISFKYFSYDTAKKRVYRNQGQEYKRTPIAMCWNDDNYYLITYIPKAGDPFATFRVDRMAKVQVLDEKADKFDRKSFDVAEYVKRTFGMYSGETVSAKLAFDESLVSVVLDHFGADTHITNEGNGRFSISVDVSSSPVFLAWIFQFGSKAEILAPDSLRNAMLNLINTSKEKYEK